MATPASVFTVRQPGKGLIAHSEHSGTRGEKALIGTRRLCLTPGEATTSWQHSGHPEILRVSPPHSHLSRWFLRQVGVSPPPVAASLEMILTLADDDLKLQFAKLVDHAVHKAPAGYFRMIHSQTGEELGAINLRAGSTPHLLLYAGHIGYALHPAHRGHRYAARSVRLLIPVARQLQFETLWIT